jgi:inner membrane protein
MASFGHVAVGLLTGRLHGGKQPAPGRRCSFATLALFGALAALPDADVVAVALGAHDGGVLGHRGASHSLCAALAMGLICALLARRLGWPALRTGVAAALAVASHGLLDAIGEGGRGIPLLWPFTASRFMSPWRLLPDAPRGLKFLSRHGLVDLALEFLVFLPATMFALWPARPQPVRLVVIEGTGGQAARTLPVAPHPPSHAPSHEGEREPPARSSG